MRNGCVYTTIAIAIDDLGVNWPALMGLASFPFIEIRVDRELIAGCADDPLKKTVCRRIRIIDLGQSYGLRTTAKGVEGRADFLVVSMRWVSTLCRAICSANQ